MLIMLILITLKLITDTCKQLQSLINYLCPVIFFNKLYFYAGVHEHDYIWFMPYLVTPFLMFKTRLALELNSISPFSPIPRVTLNAFKFANNVDELWGRIMILREPQLLCALLSWCIFDKEGNY